MTLAELEAFLDEKAAQYEHPDFIGTDPIQIPHRYKLQQDIEVAGFLTATIAWGNRTSILKSATKMMTLMGNSPYDFVCNCNTQQLEQLNGFVHRTFNAIDFKFFVWGLKALYASYNTMEDAFVANTEATTVAEMQHHFRAKLLQNTHEKRSEKHIADPLSGSSAKRLNMFFRWMVRSNAKGVDFGLWKQISPAQLSLPLDVHTGNIARKLKLLQRKQNDAKALEQLDKKLRKFDATDPVKYDFALFGLGAFENF